MILHLVLDDKFTDYTIKQFDTYHNSDYLIVQDTPLCMVKQKEALTQVSYLSREYNEIRDNLSRYNAIIIHGLYTPWQADFILAAPPFVKIAWCMWGGEVYQRPDICMSFLAPWNKRLQKLRDWIKGNNRGKIYNVPTEVFSRVDYLLSDEYEEFQFACNYFHKTDWRYLWYNYYSIEETLGTLMNSYVDGNNILLGHNAGIRTNHIDGFFAAKKLNLHGRKIVSVMAYGDSWYRHSLMKIGKLLFGKQFQAQVDFLPRNQYNEMLRSCPTVVFPTYKPEAMGNCLTALWMGARLYMYECNMQYQYFKRLGLKVFTIDRDFNRKNKQVFEPLSQQDILYNREILMREYGFNEMDVRIRELIKEIDK